MQTSNAHFDGRFIVLDEPAPLKPNDKLTVIAPDADNRRLGALVRVRFQSNLGQSAGCRL